MDQRSKSSSRGLRGKLSSLYLSSLSADLLLSGLVEPGLDSSGPLLVEVLERDDCKIDSSVSFSTIKTTGRRKETYRCCASP